MPEDNFEQQARQKAEPFSMEPNANVWQRVQAAIAPPKRRRRLLVWWWLLPIGLASGFSIYVMNHQHTILSNKKNNTAADIVSDNSNQPVILHYADTSGKQNTEIKKKQDNPVVLKSSSALQEQKAEAEKTNKIAFHFFTKKIKENEFINRQTKVVNIEDKEIKATKNESEFPKLQHQEEALNITNDYASKALPALPLTKQQVFTDTAKSDTLSVKNNKDTVLNKSDKPVASNKINKQYKKKWQFGISAELGVSSRGIGLFNIFSNDQNKALIPSTYLAQDNAAGNVIDTSILVYQTVKRGVDVAIGVAIHKPLSHNFYVSGQFAYRYQQYSINNSIADSLSVNGSLSIHTVGNENYKLHFFNIFTGVGWHFFTIQKTTISLETGLDNSLLLGANQEIVNQAAFANRNVSGNANNVYRWQPQVNIYLPVAFYTKNNLLQVSPFARFGLRSLQKNSLPYKDNHLISAGVSAIYFFK